ncbi:MAG TPA: TIM barrel protein [Solirubrobacteraceae bacterium]|nr:TIM barrel protein [Solirubrobacteraceae bacterium]
MTHVPRYAVNCSLIFTELPVLERPAAARAAGFDAIEFWWPWQTPTVSDAELDAFAAAVRDAGVQLVGLNFFAGDLLGPDCGVASIPARTNEFRENIELVIGLGGRLATRRFNALFGNRVDGVAASEQDELGVAALIDAARAAGSIGATVMVEPVSGPKPYPLRTAADAMAIADRVRREGRVDNIGLLADFFHLARNGDDVAAAIDSWADDIVHVQIADAPGRHEPGTGELDLRGWTTRLLDAGYDGWIALEYVPSGSSADSFGWLPVDERAAAIR